MNWKIAILTLAAALPAFGQTKWSAMAVETTFADGDWLMLLDASELPGAGNNRAALSTLRDWWFSSDDTMTLGAGGGSVVLTFASTGTDPTLTATNGTVTFGGVASLALGTMIFDADQTIGAGQDNFVLTYDNAGGLIALEAATGGGNVSDNTSEAITGTWEIQDDVDFVFGNDANWLVQYDEAVDDQLLFVTTGTAAIATTDPMFEILVGTTPTADQQVFGIAKGSQATNTPLFTVDEDGDVTAAGDINVTNATAATLQFSDTDGSPSVAGQFRYDNTVTGLLDGAMAWYDDDSVRYLVDVDTLPVTDGDVVAYNAANDEFEMVALPIRTIGATWDGGGSAITTGKAKGFFRSPIAGTIVGYSITADAGTATVKTWKIADGTAKPTVANVISTAGVSLAAGTHIDSSTVTDFTTTAVAVGDIFAFDLTAVATATELTFQLEIQP